MGDKTITFADYMEKILGMNYSSAEKEYLNKIFLTRETTLKPRRKDGKSERRMLLALLAKDYEEFIFNEIKRRMEEQSRASQARIVSRHSQAL